MMSKPLISFNVCFLYSFYKQTLQFQKENENTFGKAFSKGVSRPRAALGDIGNKAAVFNDQKVTLSSY